MPIVAMLDTLGRFIGIEDVPEGEVGDRIVVPPDIDLPDDGSYRWDQQTRAFVSVVQASASQAQMPPIPESYAMYLALRALVDGQPIPDEVRQYVDWYTQYMRARAEVRRGPRGVSCGVCDIAQHDYNLANASGPNFRPMPMRAGCYRHAERRCNGAEPHLRQSALVRHQRRLPEEAGQREHDLAGAVQHRLERNWTFKPGANDRNIDLRNATDQVVARLRADTGGDGRLIAEDRNSVQRAMLYAPTTGGLPRRRREHGEAGRADVDRGSVQLGGADISERDDPSRRHRDGVDVH